MSRLFGALEEAGLAESIALEKFRIRQKLSHPMDKFRRHWRAAISQNLEAGQVIRFCFGHLRQQVQHCRDEHRVSYAFALDQLTETLGGELRKCDLPSAESRCCEHGGKNRHVKNRRRLPIDTALPVSHPIAEVVDGRQGIGVSHRYGPPPSGSSACGSVGPEFF